MWYCYKSGLGIEIARTRRLLGKLAVTYSVSYASFHGFLYDESAMAVRDLSEGGPAKPTVGEPNRLGIAFVCGERPGGPFRDAALEKEARARGYLIVGEDLGSPHLPTYQAAQNLSLRICGRCETEISVLRRADDNDSVVLNLFGGATLSKGLCRSEQICQLVSALNSLCKTQHFVVPVLPHQEHLIPREAPSGSTVSFARFDYSDFRLTELVAGAKAIVTVEGGMLHLSVAYAKRVACLIESAWLAKVEDLLPPRSSFGLILADFDRGDPIKLAMLIKASVNAV